MKFLRNAGTERTLDLIKPLLLHGSSMDMATSSLSLFAFAEPLNELASIQKTRLLLSSEEHDLKLFGTEHVVVNLAGDLASPDIFSAFLQALSITRQPRANLRVLYQGWMDTLPAFQAAQITGTFAQSETKEQASSRRTALQDCQRLEAETARLRNVAAKEKQLARRVEMNIEIQRLQREFEAATRQLMSSG